MTMRAFGRHALAIVAVSVLGACGGDRGASDTAAGGTPAETMRGTTGAMPGMNHDSMSMGGMDMPHMNRPAPKDADQEFLRMMADHHQGMIEMATAAMSKGSTPAVQDDAHKLHLKQQEEQKKMIAMDQSAYGESLTPMTMGDNKAMNDSLQAKSGADYDRSFYATVVKHHQQGVHMIDQFLPRLKNAELRQMAGKMKADQQKEIEAFQRKAS